MQVKDHGPEVAWRGWINRALPREEGTQIFSGLGSLQVTVLKVWV